MPSDFFIDQAWRSTGGAKREVALVGCAVLIAVPIGYAAARIRMGYNGGPMGSNNASLLGRCIRYGDCNPIRELRNIPAKMYENPVSPIDAPEAKRQISDLVELYNKWRDSAAIAIIAPQRTPALVRLGTQDALRANNLLNDNLSPTLMTRFANSLDMLPVGSLIMTINLPSAYELGLICDLLKRYRFEWVDSEHDTFVGLVPRDNEFEIGSPVIEINGKSFLRAKDGSSIPVKAAPAGTTAGFVEQFRLEEDSAIVSGWVIDMTTLTVPKIVVLSLQGRIWALARSGIERTDVAGINAAFRKSGFRSYVCGVDRSAVRRFRAYALSDGRSATELQYSAGVPPGNSP